MAQRLYQQQINEADLPQLIPSLRLPDKTLIETLGNKAAEAARTQPRYGWAITAVTHTAAQQTNDLLLQSLSAWYLARAANAWLRPQRVETAVAHARAGFLQLDQPGWIAACDWQLNAVPWTRPNFPQTASALEQALADLQTANLSQFTPYCRHSLAHAYLLIGRFDEAAAQIDHAEIDLAAAQDQLGLAQCLYMRASCQRRRSQFEQAHTNIKRALTIFQSHGDLNAAATCQINLAYILYSFTRDVHAAESLFQQAIQQFRTADLPLLEAQCYGGLGQIYNYTGQPIQAKQSLQQAGEIYTHYQIPGLQADNLLDQGLFEQFRGHYSVSLSYFQQAQSLYERVGNRWLPVIALMDQGYVSFQQGRYHQALHFLEKAHARLQTLSMPHRLAACEWRLAEVWLQLGYYDTALVHQGKAVELSHQATNRDTLPQLFILRAAILSAGGSHEEARQWLWQALSLASELNAPSSSARAQRLLAESLYTDEQYEQAISLLETAVSSFAHMDMLSEQAACYLALGRAWSAMGRTNVAETAWQQALTLSNSIAPEIEWQTHVELARHASAQGNIENALVQYRQAVTALSYLRRNLWQPELAETYLIRPMSQMDDAVILATQANSPSDVLQFIEANKAVILQQRLTTIEQTITNLPDELNEIVLEIRWLQDRLQQLGRNNRLTALSATELRQQLNKRVKQYHTAVSQLERTASPALTDIFSVDFTAAQFRLQAQETLGDQWLALNYYLAEDRLVCFVLTPTGENLYERKMTPAVYQALDRCVRGAGQQPGIQRSLAILGEWLLPPSVQAQLTPDTFLLIAPHRKLHYLPWAGLYLQEQGELLVNTAVPVIIPSFHALSFLWQRQRQNHQSRHQGLLLTIADFSGRHRPLPAVTRETAVLAQQIPNATQLSGDNATLFNLRQLHQNEAWQQYDFLHIASHAFADKLTGRLSGIALHDQDLWLDELQQLAPLPPLVTLSACSGIQTMMRAGDEPTGLAVTCLASGAQRVIGSIWPVQDTYAPDLMTRFYKHLLAGNSASQSLAYAQRLMLQTDNSIAHWIGFLCVGQP
ncbi:MAG: CHAT domain-containing protein [Ardenticatenaceae bacterium]|nr:CHAT domain-containing protein [Ardenticatenaceae bacterium]MCB9004439.1 CHAT domain-containing protein [Ardenticatenaceae bacterium]